MKSYLYLLILLTLFVSCDNDSSYEDVDISNISLDLKVNRLEIQQLELTDLQKSSVFLDKNPSFVNFMLQNSLPSKEMLTQVLVEIANDTQNQELLKACKNDYADFSDIEEQFLKTFKRIKYHYPDFAINEINTFSGGLTSGYDMTIYKNSLFIGIDHFLKDKEKFRPNPQVFHNYMLKFYNRENIVLKSSQLLSQKYNAYDEKDQTLLANMIFYGKSYYFVKKMNPTVSNALLVEYEQEEWNMSEEHITMIWEHFIKKELFYVKDRQLISKYIDPRPKTPEVAEACPGRIGQWLGFKIVESYMKNNPTITLQQLMAETNSQKIFQESKFKPSKN